MRIRRRMVKAVKKPAVKRAVAGKRARQRVKRAR